MRSTVDTDEGDVLLRRVTSEAERAKQMLLGEIQKLRRFPTGGLEDVPQAPGVYFVFRTDEVVYVGSSGHGKATDSEGHLRRGLRRRLLMEFTRTRLSPIRRGIAKELNRPRYKPKTKAEKDSALERRINEEVTQLAYAFTLTSSSGSALQLERLSIALLQPGFNRQ